MVGKEDADELCIPWTELSLAPSSAGGTDSYDQGLGPG